MTSLRPELCVAHMHGLLRLTSYYNQYPEDTHEDSGKPDTQNFDLHSDSSEMRMI